MSLGTTPRSHQIYRHDNDLCVVFKGRVVLEDLGELKQSILPRINREINHVFIDLQQVDYVDSAGLGLLIGIKMTAKMNGAAITLMDPNKNVKDVLAISKMDGIFEILGGAESKLIRDRIVKPAHAVTNNSDSSASSSGISPSPFANADSSIPMVNADGTLEAGDPAAQMKEAVEDHCRRAVESMRQGDYERSIECYQSALSIDPDYLPALNNLAIVYEKQPAWHPLAIDTWKRVLDLSRSRNDAKHIDRAERHLADLNA